MNVYEGVEYNPDEFYRFSGHRGHETRYMSSVDEIDFTDETDMKKVCPNANLKEKVKGKEIVAHWRENGKPSGWWCMNPCEWSDYFYLPVRVERTGCRFTLGGYQIQVKTSVSVPLEYITFDKLEVQS